MTQTMLKIDKVTNDLLRRMELGQSVTFKLPSAAAIESAKSSAYRLQNMMGCKFKAISDFANLQLTLTKTSKPC